MNDWSKYSTVNNAIKSYERLSPAKRYRKRANVVQWLDEYMSEFDLFPNRDTLLMEGQTFGDKESVPVMVRIYYLLGVSTLPIYETGKHAGQAPNGRILFLEL